MSPPPPPPPPPPTKKKIGDPSLNRSVDSDADQRKHQSSASVAFVRGIHRGPVNSPHKWPVTRKMFPFDDVMWVVGCGSWVVGRSFVSYLSSLIIEKSEMNVRFQSTLNRKCRFYEIFTTISKGSCQHDNLQCSQ